VPDSGHRPGHSGGQRWG